MLDWSRRRITVLRDAKVFDLPEDAPGLTSDGRPWARWANLGDESGWYVLGTRKPSTEDMSFWKAVWTMACEVGNGNVDAVHCIGPGVLSVGGMGVTVSSGHAQMLLADCLRHKPDVWLWIMAPVVYRTGCFVLGHGSVAVLHQVERGGLLTKEDFDGAIRGGSSGESWTTAQKATARLWVTCVSDMLRDERMDAAQVAFCKENIPRLMSDPARLRISWPTNGVDDAWMFTREQQALWALSMVLFIEDEAQAEKLLLAQVQTEPIDAKASLGKILANCEGLDFSRTFTARVVNTVRRVQELFEFSLEAA